MLELLTDTIRGAYEPSRHREALAALWELERWFDTPRQRAAAEMSRGLLIEAGLSDVRLAGYPCDGRTRCQDWTMHLAWDCPAAQLALADGGQVLADRRKVPCAVVFWSGPLASKDAPAAGEVVDGDAMETITPQVVNGKFVLTATPRAQMKRRCLGAQPLAIVSDFLGEGRGYDQHTTKWCNTWSDAPEGWYVHAADTALAGFCLSPAAGKVLRGRLAKQPRLKLAGFCDGRLYAGSGQNVTAVLPGTDPSREVWIFAHACEQGAHDNASGVTVLIEAMRMLNALIEAGRLARPRHSIRMITTEECVGMAAFATLNDDARRRALVGLNVDGAGDASDADYPFVAHYGPLSAPTFGWAAAAVIADALKRRAGDAWCVRTQRFVSSGDDMIADPNCGVPNLWLGMGGTSRGYHSSADTPAVCSDASLRYNTLLTAIWAYAMASMDDALAGALVGPATAWIDGNIVRAGDDDPAVLSRWVAGRILRDLGRWGVSAPVFEPAAARYAPAGAEPLPDLPADGPRFFRRTWGTCTFETLPPDRREGLSCWSGWVNAGLYWNDGRRPLSAVERLARAETGAKPDASLRRAFDACLEAGLMVQDNTPNFAKR